MSQFLSSTSSWGSGGGASGGRRQKVYQYLRAANELRQTYAAQWSAQINPSRGYDEEYLKNTPGAFPDIEIARSEDEEMVIFPSYARRLVKDHNRQRRGSTSTLDEYRGVAEETELERLEREILEDENAIVAVDVRGWVYSPHRGPMNRKQRLLIALARKLSGVPAPSNYSTDTEGPDSDTASIGKASGKRDDELVDAEAQSIIRNAEGRADAAWKSSASERDGEAIPGRPLHRTTTSLTLEPSQMSMDELSVANAHLMERLRPFLSNPMNQQPVTVFFFNDGKSQSRSVLTDESGHFTLRAALPFIPTHIRVLASEELSAMKQVEVIEPSGVSLISDIDDTVKHSAIASGAKEIFRNTFIRELADLTVDGVSEWYTSLVKMGVQIHYVSNSPWQLYPLLERYFKLAGLPPGSFHLKQYSGMLQGIFEPTAERKKGSLEQLLRDFPTRRFILVGDSGEADLEVYTDVALANPGRILGIFIRDVTTSDQKQFFEKSIDHLEPHPSRTRSTPQLIDTSDTATNRPALPPRRPRAPDHRSADAISLDNADLIDLRDDDDLKDTQLTRPSHRTDAYHQRNHPSHHPYVPFPPCQTSQERAVHPRCKRPSNGSQSRPYRRVVLQKPQLHQTHYQSAPKHSTKQIQSNPKNSRGPNNPLRHPHPAEATREQHPQQQPRTQAQAANHPKNNHNHTPQPLYTTNPSPARSSTNSLDSDQQSVAGSAPPAPLPNKREELWRRRWERAHEILTDKGVVLGSWRVGTDIQDVTVWLVQEAMKDVLARIRKETKLTDRIE
ncbi:actin cytoskeleton organization protein App1 [Aspergillus nomiae NRRL 13137]|uniref:Actin cytoskeleton organization protein App1 n=1 Tax=Aspergillus nomiae NRRL (strain ATCC 15546 / NRRL 13137 / CBS 260.88 / M93) TaxID=1509407 RepID=A0A0L1JCV1_ASPN3|nr:actin cytoskeleton organization protein App1 [Aspergillus nomiae NRRL 13137]KNG89565.1 actin cytoskeleton organization protein App1 [Aspergillus nomiae NRRL 13137]